MLHNNLIKSYNCVITLLLVYRLNGVKIGAESKSVTRLWKEGEVQNKRVLL